MSLGHSAWKGRRKRASRRLRRDLRSLLPLAGVVLCFASSATVIFATESTSSGREAPPPVAARGVLASRLEPAPVESSHSAPHPRLPKMGSHQLDGTESASILRFREARPRR